jgi:hypothetical protein
VLPRLPYKWRVFIHGCIAAILNSISSTVTMAIVDPADFNPFTSGDWSKIGSVVIVSAIVGLFTYLKTHPLPDPEKDTDALFASEKAVARLETSMGTGAGGPARL